MRTSKTIKIHEMIEFICKHLRTEDRYTNYLYRDKKILLCSDFYSSARIVYPNGETEQVFWCNADRICQTYRPGKWEEYINKLFLKAERVAKEENEKRKEQEKELFIKNFGIVSSKADSIFD